MYLTGFFTIGVKSKYAMKVMPRRQTCFILSSLSVLCVFMLQTGAEDVSLTCLEYGTDSSLYVASSNGKVSAWDTRHNTCFMHWDADTAEIGT